MHRSLYDFILNTRYRIFGILMSTLFLFTPMGEPVCVAELPPELREPDAIEHKQDDKSSADEDAVIDLIIDSDNNEYYLKPSDKNVDFIEDGPGKYIISNREDCDNDGIRAWDDGYNADGINDTNDDLCLGKYVPMVLRIKDDSIDVNNSTITFSGFTTIDPVSGSNLTTDSLVANSVRLWKSSVDSLPLFLANNERSRQPVTNAGDFIPVDTAFAPSLLGFSSTEREVVIWVEGLGASSAEGGLEITAELDRYGDQSEIHKDSVAATVYQAGIEIVEVPDYLFASSRYYTPIKFKLNYRGAYADRPVPFCDNNDVWVPGESTPQVKIVFYYSVEDENNDEWDEVTTTTKLIRSVDEDAGIYECYISPTTYDNVLVGEKRRTRYAGFQVVAVTEGKQGLFCKTIKSFVQKEMVIDNLEPSRIKNSFADKRVFAQDPFVGGTKVISKYVTDENGFIISEHSGFFEEKAIGRWEEAKEPPHISDGSFEYCGMSRDEQPIQWICSPQSKALYRGAKIPSDNNLLELVFNEGDVYSYYITDTSGGNRIFQNYNVGAYFSGYDISSLLPVENEFLGTYPNHDAIIRNRVYIESRIFNTLHNNLEDAYSDDGSFYRAQHGLRYGFYSFITYGKKTVNANEFYYVDRSINAMDLTCIGAKPGITLFNSAIPYVYAKANFADLDPCYDEEILNAKMTSYALIGVGIIVGAATGGSTVPVLLTWAGMLCGESANYYEDAIYCDRRTIAKQFAFDANVSAISYVQEPDCNVDTYEELLAGVEKRTWGITEMSKSLSSMPLDLFSNPTHTVPFSPELRECNSSFGDATWEIGSKVIISVLFDLSAKCPATAYTKSGLTDTSYFIELCCGLAVMPQHANNVNIVMEPVRSE